MAKVDVINVEGKTQDESSPDSALKEAMASMISF